jgi:hypothetical protein
MWYILERFKLFVFYEPVQYGKGPSYGPGTQLRTTSSTKETI